MEYLINLLLLFFAFSFIGWCIEVTLKYRQFHRFINRGFLTGPWLPIYGFGAVLITVSVQGIAGLESSIGTTFVISFYVCGIVEYLASYFLEKRYHARWWDYSQKPMNLKGRVWIGNLILFGLGGIAIIELANPIFYDLFSRISLMTRSIIAGLLSCVFITDYISSQFIMKMVKAGVENSEADNTEEINKEILLLFSDKSYFYRRFADAYPDVIYRTEKIKAHMEEVRIETERLRAEAEVRLSEMNERLAESREQFAATVDPVGTAKNKMISKQESLIELLYDEESATDEMKGLVEEIAECKSIIEKRRIGGNFLWEH
ncbi:putative ABC transporter permease [Pseudobutyrivibrio xylanivorans]|uniref:Uncharacterized membrane protein n=1 Tax=Pseudobutyrivibrio xylanivorans TaxID=185007 RepID=A0A1G5S414_PSEXY|nr:putative ABC transporter permease [Pseudobutyrivibrio xylanivorans]SCZ81056.1 Uncharacterized membrane protein [Pseudobutyrivibrio xylanivorans]